MASEGTKQEFQRTVDAKPNDLSIVKPGELVDIVELDPLTLTDRRIYNLLLANAWDRITEDVEHVIRKQDLRHSDDTHKGTERLDESLRRLMGAIVTLRVLENGSWEKQQVALIGQNAISEAPGGLLRYRFDEAMRKIIGESRVFARLHKQIMFALSSKYSLALYEMIQKRGNMNRTSEEITIEDFRNFLGVPKGKLSSWINFKNFAITPAIKEVSDLSDFKVLVEPLKGKGKKFDRVRLCWERKRLPELREVKKELDNVSIGRKARLSGTVEKVTFGPPALPASGTALQSDTFDKARRAAPGFDVYALEGEWRTWAAGKPAPDNPDAAFIAFCREYAKRHPLH